jgi:hypothetical protein
MESQQSQFCLARDSFGSETPDSGPEQNECGDRELQWQQRPKSCRQRSENDQRGENRPEFPASCFVVLEATTIGHLAVLRVKRASSGLTDRVLR